MSANIPVPRRSVTDFKGMLCLALCNEVFSTVLISIGKIEIGGKFVSDHATKLHKGGYIRVYSSTILNLGSRWRLVVNCMIQESCEEGRKHELI
jgi:hypothetical protein